MRMTYTLASELMDCLVCVALSANGGVAIDENGNADIDEKTLEEANKYARQTFCNILEAWEDVAEEKWEIIEDNEDERY